MGSRCAMVGVRSEERWGFTVIDGCTVMRLKVLRDDYVWWLRVAWVHKCDEDRLWW